MLAAEKSPAASQVPYVDFRAQFTEEQAELLARLQQVLAHGDFILGAEVDALEGELAATAGARFAVALNSGTDALIFGLKSLGIGPGDEVITPPNSFVASTAAIVHVGAKPIFADVLPDQNIDPAAIEAAITPRTRAIMPVHLTGRICNMSEILAIAYRYGLAVIEDAAQSIGSRYDGRLAGSFGAVACFSLHPLKNLNAAGDAGFLATNDPMIAERTRRLRNHGQVDRNTVAEFGWVSRLDTLQATILRYRLQRLPEVIRRRRNNAARYQSELKRDHLFAPPCRSQEFNTFHTFVVQVDNRDGLKEALAAQGIGTAIHYPVPIHLQPAARELGYRRGDFPMTERQADRILSLPINQYLGVDDIDRVITTINRFYAR